jgi:sirohydrochlorin cobaltochelatase
MVQGLILFAHGARDPRWAEPFQSIARRVTELRPELRMRLAYLELMEPALQVAADELVAEGCQAISVQPMFLGTGGHLRRDLPLLMAELAQRHPGVTWSQQPAIGEQDAVQHAMAVAALKVADLTSP